MTTDPRLALPGRSYLLFKGPLRASGAPGWAERSWGEAAAFWNQTPNQPWQDDQAWFLASEIDFDSTLTGGARAIIDELVGCRDIEAVEIPADASLSHDADRNTRYLPKKSLLDQ